MRNGFLGAVIALLAGASLAGAQPYYGPYPPPQAYPAYPAYPQYPQYQQYQQYQQYPQYQPYQQYPGYPPAQRPMQYPAPQYAPYPGQVPVYNTNYAPQPQMQNPQAMMPRPGQGGLWKEPEPQYIPRSQSTSNYPLQSPAPAAQQPLEIPPTTLESPKALPNPAAIPEVLRGDAPPMGGDIVPGTSLFSEEAPAACPAPPTHEAHPPNIAPRGYCYYGDVEGLAWITRRSSLPILATNDLPNAPGASVLLGGNNSERQEHYGVKGTLGYWLNPFQTASFEIGGFWLQQHDDSNTVNSTGNSNIFRPYVVTATNDTVALPVAIAGVTSGSMTLTHKENEFWGAESNMRLELRRTDCVHVDALFGVRYVDLEDSVTISDNSQFTGERAALGKIQSTDSYGARNRFYGGQTGLSGEYHWGSWYASLYGKIAVGYMDEQVNVSGATSRAVVPGGPLVAGFLPSVGQHSRDEVAYVPEAGFSLGYTVSNNLRVTAGCSAMYVSRVVRAGDHIDQNLSQIPVFNWHTTDFWAQGVNMGVEFRY